VAQEFRPDSRRVLLLALAAATWGASVVLGLGLLFGQRGAPLVVLGAVVAVAAAAFTYWHRRAFGIAISPAALGYHAPLRPLRSYPLAALRAMDFTVVYEIGGRGGRIPREVIYLDPQATTTIDVTAFDLPTLRQALTALVEAYPPARGRFNERAWAILRGQLRRPAEFPLVLLRYVLGLVGLGLLPFLRASLAP
jgi:hypothetical protein